MTHVTSPELAWFLPLYSNAWARSDRQVLAVRRAADD
eukprot:CAMPEP_0119383228 /NCGR_PEP_ID=MMETSP1334-20130426/77990_1 /TAXON_ID=127549 /ORGANISM="Calcidiscus leptoporus, Strain RCC1130" /LENGTH=36 /DNA_ID= /DNA_START= /DNA_END= /DNA_ORIENTATION=